jgi:hypothetical protein
MGDAVFWICITVLIALFAGQDPLIDRIGRPPGECVQVTP